MKALLLMYWKRLRYTPEDRQRAMRGECMNAAARFDAKQPGDYLHNARLLYEWWEHGRVPTPDNHQAGPTLQ